MKCGNGTDTGVGVNLQPGATKLFIYMQGGGACWDAATCFALRSAVGVTDGYGGGKFEADKRSLTAGPFDRGAATNLWSDASFVFVPYCTGDLHAGSRVAEYLAGNPMSRVYHVGGANMDVLLPRLRGTVPAATTVWLTGSSAGGYGALLNLERVARGFSTAEVHVLSDCGVPVTPEGDRWSAWQTNWPLGFPMDCTDCKRQFPALVDALAARFPRSRIGLLAYDNDATLTLYLGLAAGDMKPRLDALLAGQFSRSNTRAFVLAGVEHVMLDKVAALTSPGGVKLADWVQAWGSGDPGWTTVK
jgi:hypothetical protein